MVPTNLSESEYLYYELGPQQLPIIIAVPLNLLYLIIFVIGIIGNLATCMITVKNPLMQNATNYYLFSLAVSDLILLILGKCKSIMQINYYYYVYQSVFHQFYFRMKDISCVCENIFIYLHIYIFQVCLSI